MHLGTARFVRLLFTFIFASAAQFLFSGCGGCDLNLHQNKNQGIGSSKEPSPAALVLSTLSPVTVEESCSPPINLHVQDENGNPIAVSSPVQLNFVMNQSSAQLFMDSTCSNPMTPAMSILKEEESEMNFHIRTDETGLLLIRVDSPGLNRGELQLSVNPKTVQALSMSGPGNGSLGVCTGLTVTTLNSQGNPILAPSNVVVSLSSNAATEIYSDIGCSNTTSTVVVSNQTSSVQFFIKENSPGSVIMSGVAGAGLNANHTINFAPPSPTGITLGGPSTGQVNQCIGPFNAQSVDSLGNPTPVNRLTTVNLSGAGTGGAFYFDSGCASQTAEVFIQNQQSISDSFYYKNTMPVATTFIGQASGLGTANHSVSITPSPPTSLNIQGQTSVNAGQCSNRLTVTTLNSSGQRTPVGANTVITLSSTGNGLIYSDANCTTQIAQLILSGGSSLTGFYFKDAVAETARIDANSAGFSGDSHNITVNPVGPSSFSVVGPSRLQAQPTSQCGTTPNEFEITTPVNVISNRTFSLVPGGSETFYAFGSNCTTPITQVTILQGSNSVRYEVMNSTVEIVSHTVQSTVFPSVNKQVDFFDNGGATTTSYCIDDDYNSTTWPSSGIVGFGAPSSVWKTQHVPPSSVGISGNSSNGSFFSNYNSVYSYLKMADDLSDQSALSDSTVNGSHNADCQAGACPTVVTSGTGAAFSGERYYLFDGSNDQLTFSSLKDVPSSFSEITYMAWVYPEGTGRQAFLYYGTQPNISSQIFSIGMNSAGNLETHAWERGKTSAQTFTSQAQVPLFKWSHIAVTHDGLTLRMYIDGQIQGEFSLRSLYQPNAPFEKAIPIIAAMDDPFRTNPSNPFFRGRMDEALILNEALNGQTIYRTATKTFRSHAGFEALRSVPLFNKGVPYQSIKCDWDLTAGQIDVEVSANGKDWCPVTKNQAVSHSSCPYTSLMKYRVFLGSGAEIDRLKCTCETTRPSNQNPVSVPTSSGSSPFTAPCTPISFDGSLSYDPDGSITTYSWDLQGSGTRITGGGLTISTCVTRPGRYDATLTIVDNNGASHSATASAMVGTVGGGGGEPNVIISPIEGSEGGLGGAAGLEF